ASLPMDRGRDEAAVAQIVYRIQEDALPLGLGPHLGVGRAIVGPRDGEPRAREIARPIRAAPEIDPARHRELRQAGRGLGTHHGDMRTRREQAEHFLLGHRAAADHHGAAPTQVEKHRVERHELTGTEARRAAMPTRWQKSPNRSSPSRSSRWRSNSGRPVATSRAPRTRSAYNAPTLVPSILPSPDRRHLRSLRPAN